MRTRCRITITELSNGQFRFSFRKFRFWIVPVYSFSLIVDSVKIKADGGFEVFGQNAALVVNLFTRALNDAPAEGCHFTVKCKTYKPPISATSRRLDRMYAEARTKARSQVPSDLTVN